MHDLYYCGTGTLDPGRNHDIACDDYRVQEVYTIAEQVSDTNAIIAQYLIDNPLPGGSSPTDSQLTYDDFQLLGGAILSMFLIAYGLKQIRLIINR